MDSSPPQGRDEEVQTMSEQREIPQQAVAPVAVDPRRRWRRVFLGGAAAAALAAALAVAVAAPGGTTTATAEPATSGTASGTAQAQEATGSSDAVVPADAPVTDDPAGGPAVWYGRGQGPWSGYGGAYGGSSDGSSGAAAAAAAQAAATAATDAQEAGVVTVTSELGYEGAVSAGTGMILSADGLVLTNHHVVEGATSIEVTDESTGRAYTATVLGTDASADVALLRLDGATGLTPVALDDDGNLADGDAVTAIGNAEGTGDLVAAAGTVTGTDQTMTASSGSGSGAETLSGLIEFSADVVSGDSGGPLVDAEGEVVGMTTAASSGPGATTAYAIDISDALLVVGQIESGVVSDGVTLGYPAFLGVWFASSPFGYGASGWADGALVAGVLDGTPAAAAGLAAGDTITTVDGQSVTSSEDLAEVMATLAPGEPVVVTWVSGATGATSSATVTLAEGPVA